MPDNPNAPDDLEALRSIVTALDPFDAPDRERIIRWACEKLGIALPSGAQGPGVGPQLPTDATTPPEVGTPVQLAGKRDLRTFIAEKKPVSDTNFATAVTYYYQFEAPESERKNAITAEDLVQASRLADRTRLQNPGQTLRNAMQAGFLDRAERGAFKINAVGENLVAMALPASGPTVRAKASGKPRRRPGKKALRPARGGRKGKAAKGTKKRAKRR